MASLEQVLAANQRHIDELHQCQPGQTALLVIDMQHGFLDPGAALEVPAGRAIVPNIKRLIDSCRQKRVPIVFTEFVYSTAVPCLRGDPFGIEHLPAEPGRPTGFGYPSSNCLIGPTPGTGPNSADTIPELAPRPDELVVRAHTYDKFYGTALDLALRCRSVSYLLVTGIVTEICVNATLMSASTRDYRVTAVTDAVASVDEKLQQACFAVWRRKFARLRETEEVIAELDGWSAR